MYCRPLLAIAVGSALLASVTPQAQATPWYVGANVGRSDFGGDCPAFASCDTRDTGWRLYGGYQFHPNFAVEAGYADFGQTTASVGGLGADIKASGWTAHLVGILPLPYRFSLLAKVGGIYGESKVGGAFGSTKERGTNWAYGLGVGYDVLPNVGIRAEWERYRFDSPGGGNADLDLISIGVKYRF